MAKYRKVATVLEKKIERGELTPHSQFPSEQALASELSVSRVTIRKAMDILKEKGLLVKQQGKATFVSPNNKKTILYIGDFEAHLHQRIHAELINRSQQKQFRFISNALPENKNDESWCEHILSQISESDFLILDISAEDECPKFLLQQTLPTIVISGIGLKFIGNAYNIMYNMHRSVQLAVDYLYQKGHRRIALLTNESVPPEERTSLNLWDKSVIYWGTMNYFGIKDQGAVICQSNDAENDDMDSIERFLKKTKKLPTAFVCTGDHRAVCLYKVCNRLGYKIPEDFSVIGAGNTPWCDTLYPELTTISFNEIGIAQLVMSIIYDHNSGKPFSVRMDPYIIERDSVKSVSR